MTIKSPRFTEEEIRAALAAEGSITKAAVALGISRQTLHEYLKHYAIPRQRRTVAA